MLLGTDGIFFSSILSDYVALGQETMGNKYRHQYDLDMGMEHLSVACFSKIEIMGENHPHRHHHHQQQQQQQ